MKEEKKFLDFYKILGIDFGADENDIKKAYRQACKKYHPDENINASEEEKLKNAKKFGIINRAFDILTDSEKRERYDYEYQKIKLNKGSKEINVMTFEKRRQYENEEVFQEETNNKQQAEKSSSYGIKNLKINKTLLKRIAIGVGTLVLAGSFVALIKFSNEEEEQQITRTEHSIIIDGVEYKSYTTIYRNYEVKAGDTLSQLADDAGVSYEQIEDLNGLNNDETLQAGSYIRVPYSYLTEDIALFTTEKKVEENMSLEEFAKANETDLETLCDLNEESIIKSENGTYCNIADELKVPNFITQKELNDKKENSFTNSSEEVFDSNSIKK